MSLKTKFAVVTGAMILAVATGITAFLTHQQTTTIRNELTRRAVALTENLAYNCQLPLVTANATSLQRLGNGLLKDAEVAYVQFEDSTGTVLVRVGAVDRDSLRAAQAEGAGSHPDGGRTAWMRTGGGGRFLDVYAPVTLGGATTDDILAANRLVETPVRVGGVHVGMTTQYADERIALMRWLATLLGIAVALGGSVAAAFAIHRLTRPMEQLMEGNRRVARGDFSLRLQVRSRDEFGRLASSWNQMANEIQRSRELANRYFDSLRTNAEELEEANRSLKRKNEEIAKASRMKSEFLAIMSHELRTPLNGILGFSEVLLDEKFGHLNDKQKRFVENTLTSGRHLLRLINDLLDLSKIEAGKLEIAPAGFDLRQSLDEIQTLVRGLAIKKDIALHCGEVPARTAHSDPKLFKQVMFNLLSNAIKFTPAGGRVDVTVRCLSGRTLRAEPIAHALPAARQATIPERQLVLVEVQDTGIGIAPEDHEKIFLPFQQLDSSYARRQEGTGLGLALVRRILLLLGGDIWFTSCVGEGSRFVFYVPLEHCEDDLDEPLPRPADPQASQAAAPAAALTAASAGRATATGAPSPVAEASPRAANVMPPPGGEPPGAEPPAEAGTESRLESALWPWGEKALVQVSSRPAWTREAAPGLEAEGRTVAASRAAEEE